MKKGLLKQQIIDTGTKSPVIISKEISSKTYSHEEILKLFNQHIANGKILPVSYNAQEWNLIHRLKDKRCIINFSDFNIKTQEHIKSYITILLQEYESLATAATISKLINIINITDNFQKNDIDTLENLATIIIYQNEYSIFDNYLSFIHADRTKTRVYEDILSNNIQQGKARTLPSFESVLKFENIINKFLKQDYKYYSNEFYIIALWWKLTMIIPMRPIEFAVLKTTSFIKENNEYYVIVDRALKSDPDENEHHTIPLVNKLQITEELYNLFQKYIENTTILKEKYLFNTLDHTTWNDRELMGRNVLTTILNNFYQTIVENRYNYTVIKKESKAELEENEIEKINYGDTRHLAFLNLILQGYNPYTIAQIGGHRKLESQLSYYSCATSYCMSKSLALSLGAGLYTRTHNKSIEDYRKQIIRNNKAELDTALYIPEEDGYCTSKNFPYECYSSSCRQGRCPYFYTKNQNFIEDDIKEIEKTINNQILLLRTLIYTEPNESATRNNAVNIIKDNVAMLARIYANKHDNMKG